jgi:hypothetical protein
MAQALVISIPEQQELRQSKTALGCQRGPSLGPILLSFDVKRSSYTNKYLGPNWLADQDNSFIWELIDVIPDDEPWRTNWLLKMIMIASIQERPG